MIQLFVAGVCFWLFECRRPIMALAALEILLRWAAHFARTDSPLCLPLAAMAGGVVCVLLSQLFGKGGAKK